MVGNPIPVAFYQDDPSVAYTNTQPNPHLETIYINIPGGLAPGESLDTTIWVNGAAGAFTLYTSLNDIGPFDQATGSSLTNSAFYPLDELNGTIRECDTEPDVIAAPVTPVPATLTAAVVQNNTRCPGGADTDGVVTASVNGDTLNVIFRWYEGSAVQSVPDYLGATQRGLTGGTYTVTAEATNTACSFATQTIEVQDLATAPTVVATITQDQVSCDLANPTGSLSAYVDQGGSAVVAGYDFFWYRGLNNVTPARPGYSGGPTVDQLPAGDYRLVVTDPSTGCVVVEDVVIAEALVTPPLQLESKQDVTFCSSANGEATVSVGGVTTGYDFYWYAGNVSAPDTTAGVIATDAQLLNQPEGTYTAFAADEATRCLSNPITVTIRDRTSFPPLIR